MNFCKLATIWFHILRLPGSLTNHATGMMPDTLDSYILLQYFCHPENHHQLIRHIRIRVYIKSVNWKKKIHSKSVHPVYTVYLSWFTFVFINNLMPCPSMGSKWFWSSTSSCFGEVQFILVGLKSFQIGPNQKSLIWTWPKDLDPTKMICTRPKQFGWSKIILGL